MLLDIRDHVLCGDGCPAGRLTRYDLEPSPYEVVYLIGIQLLDVVDKLPKSFRCLAGYPVRATREKEYIVLILKPEIGNDVHDLRADSLWDLIQAIKKEDRSIMSYISLDQSIIQRTFDFFKI